MSTVRRWVSFAAVFLVGFVAFFNMFKVAPLMPVLLQSNMGFDPSNIGWLMSMFSVIGIILAFPAGMLINKIGPKATLLAAAGCCFVGSLVGALAPNAAVLFASRFIEGAGSSLASVAASVAITILIPPKSQGLAQALNVDSFPLSTFAAMNLAPLLMVATGIWNAVWWFGVVFSAFVFVYTALFFKLPDVANPTRGEGSGESVPAGDVPVDMKPIWSSIVFVGLVFCLWNVVSSGAVSNFFPMYLQNGMGLDAQASGLITSVASVIVIIASPFAGAFADRVGHRKWFLIFGIVGMAVFTPAAFSGNMGLVWVFVVLWGVFQAALPPNVYAIIPELARNPKAIVASMALVAVFQNGGTAVGSAMMGPLMANLGWFGSATMVLMPICAVGAVFAFLVRAGKPTTREL